MEGEQRAQKMSGRDNTKKVQDRRHHTLHFTCVRQSVSAVCVFQCVQDKRGKVDKLMMLLGDI